MTFEELKEGVISLTEEERMHLRAFLLHLSRVNDPANAKELSRRMAEMDAGHYYTLEDFEEMDAKLSAEGR